MNYFLFSQSFTRGTRIFLLLAILLLNFGSSGASVAYAAPPIHDDFAAAKTITGIEYLDLNVNTTEATPSDTIPNVDDPANFPCDGFNHLAGFASVWYKYTPPEAQTISLDTIGTDYDTYIAVWTGSRGSLNLVICNDETFSGFSELSLNVNAGTTYYIEIAQFNDGLATDHIGGSLDFHAYITNTNVTIGGTLRGRYFIPESGGLRRSFLNLNSGPVEINNVAGNQIIAAERVIYKVNNAYTSFSEMMGLPHSQLNTIYWLPWYNNVDLDTQLRIGNVSASPATVTITIGGVPMGSPIQLAVGASTRVSFAGVNNGPVKIVSTQNIVAAERVIYKINNIPVSFTEMMGLPNSQLNTIYWLPWYNNVDLDTQLRIGNVSASPATVTITIGGVPMGSPIQLAAGASTRVSFSGVNNGPVKIVSTQNVVAAERVIQKNINRVPVSFSEMMGLPNTQLSTIYWMPWYNNVGLDTQLRLGNVSATTATIRIFIGGTEMTGSPFTLAAGASIRKSYPGIDNGPVRIESNVNIVAAERVIYKINNSSTSFSEMMGLPNGLLDSRYWMPWYNNVDLDTQLRFALP
jgi:hypothetical protein